MEGEQQYVTMTIAAQLFGVPIMQVEDIVEPDRITMVPLASRRSPVLGTCVGEL